MDINVVHQKLGHIGHTAIKHAISTGSITGIELDLTSKLEFCEACAKAKAVQQPFLKKSQMRAMKYGEHVHWDLWRPASVQSLSGNQYVTAQIDDGTCETRLYFLKKKSQTFESYKHDEAYIKTQTGNHIKTICSNWERVPFKRHDKLSK